jgi:ribose transport system permease protein
MEIALRAIGAGPIFVLACIWAVFAILSPEFLSKANMTDVLIQASPIAVLALGALVVVMVAGIDISQGMNMGLCTLVGAILFRDHPQLAWLVIPVMIATGIAIGTANATLIVALRIGNPFIVTLGVYFMVESLSFVVSQGNQVSGMPNAVVALANRSVAGIPVAAIFALAAGGALAFVLRRVLWGRWIFAVGGSEEASTKVGIPAREVLFSVYVIAGLFAGLAAILTAGINQAGMTDSGFSVLQAIAAVVIGGASLSGGRGTVWATLVGALTLATISDGLTLTNVSTNWTPFALGAVLVAALGVDTVRKRIEDLLRIRQAQIQADAA